MANLEIIDMLCEINSRLASLVSRMATEIEQANIADEVQKSIFQEKEHCEDDGSGRIQNEEDHRS